MLDSHLSYGIYIIQFVDYGLLSKEDYTRDSEIDINAF